MLLVVAADLADQVVECLVHVDALLGRGLDERAAKMLGDFIALFVLVVPTYLPC